MRIVEWMGVFVVFAVMSGAKGDSGPILLFDFNEGEGTTAQNRGTAPFQGRFPPGAGASWGTGKNGDGLVFADKSQGFLTSCEKNQFAFERFTFACWVKPAKPQRPHEYLNVVSGPYFCPEKTANHDASGWDLSLREKKPGYYSPVFRIAFDGKTKAVEYNPETSFSPEVFTRLAASYDGKTVRLYVNGKPVLEQPGEGRVHYEVPGWGGSLKLGYFIGTIDDIALYDRALSANEILTLAGQDAAFGFLPSETPEPATESACFGCDSKPPYLPEIKDCNRFVGFTGKAYNHYIGPGPKSVRFALKNLTATAKTLTVKTVIRDWRGDVAKMTEARIPVPAKGETIAPLDLETGKYGCFFLNVQVLENGVALFEKNESYAISVDNADAAKDGELPFGRFYHDNIWYCRRIYPDITTWATCVQTPTVSWDIIEREKGKFDWAAMDFIVDKLVRRKQEIMLTFLHVPEWASTAPATEKEHNRIKKYPPRDLADWENILRLAVQRYKGKIKYWQIGAEVDSGYFLGSVEQYFEILKSAYKVIKAEYPEATVIGVGGTALWYPFCLKLFELGGYRYMDVFGIHLYGAPQLKTPAYFKRIHELVKSSGKDLPVWDTEFGITAPCRKPNGEMFETPNREFALYRMGNCEKDGQNKTYKTSGEKLIAALTIQDFVIKLANGIKKLFWFDTHAMPTGGHYGLNLVAYEAMVRFIGPGQFVRKIELGDDNLHGYLFQRKDHYLAVFWAFDAPTDIFIDPDAETVRTADFLGNEETVRPNGKLRLSLTDYPIYIIGGSARIDMAGQPFKIALPNAKVTPGGTLAVTVENADTAAMDISMTLRKGAKTLATAPAVTIGGGATRELSAVVPKDAETGEALIALNAHSGKNVYAKTARFMIVPAPVPVAHAEKTGADQFPVWDDATKLYLDKEDQVIFGKFNQNFQLTPHWTGLKDLSAIAAVKWADNGLYLAFSVTDDSLVNRAVTASVDNKYKAWHKGDSLEIFLDLRSSEERGKTEYGDGVYHLKIAPPIDGRPALFFAKTTQGKELSIEHALKGERTLRGYDIFLFIRNSAFKAKGGQPIGFNFYVNDADRNVNNEETKATLSWRGTTDNHKDPSQFGVLKLEERKDAK